MPIRWITLLAAILNTVFVGEGHVVVKQCVKVTLPSNLKNTVMSYLLILLCECQVQEVNVLCRLMRIDFMV